MARQLTKKQRKFVNEYADTGNGTKAALKSYDTESEEVAAVIAVENLSKPKIRAELQNLGFDSNNAKRVVGEILDDGSVEPHNRLKAADLVFKVQGDFAPERHINLDIKVKSPETIKKALSFDEWYKQQGHAG